LSTPRVGSVLRWFPEDPSIIQVFENPVKP
jgi:hypothetical protein